MNKKQYYDFVEAHEKDIIKRLMSRDEYLPHGDQCFSPKLAAKLAKHYPDDVGAAWDAEAKIIRDANKNIKVRLRKTFRVR